jgi:hypothetical protein
MISPPETPVTCRDVVMPSSPCCSMERPGPRLASQGPPIIACPSQRGLKAPTGRPRGYIRSQAAPAGGFPCPGAPFGGIWESETGGAPAGAGHIGRKAAPFLIAAGAEEEGGGRRGGKSWRREADIQTFSFPVWALRTVMRCQEGAVFLEGVSMRTDLFVSGCSVRTCPGERVLR